MKAKHEICTMRILVIAATKLEIGPLFVLNAPLDILISGIGVPSTIYHLQKRIQQMEYDFIIQAGIAGSFNNNIELGQTVLVKQDCFADVGIEEKENYSPIYKTGLSDEDEFPFMKGWLSNSDDNMKYGNLLKVKGITVNKVSDSELQKKQFINNFNADIESMEGAALHYVCLQEKIRFIQIRSVSNYVGERDKTKWKMKEAIQNLNKELAILINELTN